MFVFEIIDEVKEVIGSCDDETAFKRLTEAWRVLSNKAHFKSFVGYVDLCTCNQGTHFTLPVEVETPLAVNIGGRPQIFRNTWSEFHFNGAGSGEHRKTLWNWDDSGFFPTVMNILDNGEIIAVAKSINDTDALIRIFGLDENGHDLRTQDPDGTWKDGVRIPIQLKTDFPFELIKPDPDRYFVRNFATLPIVNFTSDIDHELETGAEVTLTVSIAPVPPPLVDNTNFFARLVDDNTVTLHPTREDSLADTNAIVISTADPASRFNLTDRRGFIVETKMTTTAAHNLTTGGIVGFTGTLPTPLVIDVNFFARVIDTLNYTIHPTESDADNGTNAIDIQDTVAPFISITKRNLTPTNIFNFIVDHNYLTGDAVRMNNPTGVLPGGFVEGVDFFVNKKSNTSLTLHSTVNDAQADINPINATDAGVGSSSLVKTILCSAVLGNVNNILATAHNLDLAGGDFLQFATDGVLPTPVTQNTVFQAEPPASANSFTLNDTVPNPINITAVGSGQLFLLISRAFTIGFDDTWGVDTTNLNDADEIKFDSTLTLPTCTPGIDETTTFFVKVISSGVVEIYTDAGLTSQIAINAFGTGVLFLALERTVSASPLSSAVQISPTGFLKDNAIVRFETTSALPAPLSSGVDFKVIKVVGSTDRVTFTTATDIPIVFATIGDGLHNFINKDLFKVDLAFQLQVDDNEYADGDKVTATSDGTLPPPILIDTDLFIRRISEDLVEIYDTEANSKAAPATTGRIEATGAGEGTHIFTQILPNWKVSRVDRVLKSVTNDTITVHAWDVGRKEFLTLLGEYRWYETEPRYRRIVLAQCCQWIRMRFHLKPFTIRSKEDFIPIQHTTALKLQVEALDLKDKKFLAEGQSFEDDAVKYLEEEETIQAGPETISLQMDDDVYMNTDDQYMT